MQKTKSIWASLSTVIRGVRPATSRLAHFSPNSRIRSLSSLLESSHKVPPRNVHDFLPNSKFSVQNFSSQPAENLDSTTKRCYNCCATITAPFIYCESCLTVQPVDSSIDYFQILGEEKNLDHRAVRQKFFDLCDKYRDEQRKYAVEQSKLLAEAAAALKNPVSRANYMLKLEGVHVIETRNFTDPEYLNEVEKWYKAFKRAKYDFGELDVSGRRNFTKDPRPL